MTLFALCSEHLCAASAQKNRVFTASHVRHIIIKNKQDNTCILTDVAIPTDRNAMQKKVENKLKYKSLHTDIAEFVFTCYVTYSNIRSGVLLDDCVS